MPIQKISKESDDEVEEVDEFETEDVEGSVETDSEYERQHDLPTIIEHFFTNESGDNIADVLTGFKKSLDTQNKILMKMCSILQAKTA